MDRHLRTPLGVLKNVPLGARNAVDRSVKGAPMDGSLRKPIFEKVKRAEVTPLIVFSDEPVVDSAVKEAKESDPMPFDDSFVISSENVKLEEWSEIPPMESCAKDWVISEYCSKMQLNKPSSNILSEEELLGKYNLDQLIEHCILVDNLPHLVLRDVSEADEYTEDGNVSLNDSFSFESCDGDISDWPEVPSIESFASREVLIDDFLFKMALSASTAFDSSFVSLEGEMPLVKFDDSVEDQDDDVDEEEQKNDQMFAKMEEGLRNFMEV